MSLKNIYKWIFNCQVKEFSDLEREKENFNYQREHGQCGQMDSKLHMMMELGVFKLMVYIHLLLFNARKKVNLLESFSEIQMPNPQF